MLQLTLSANAGLALDTGTTVLWVDALHRHKTNSFSSVSPKLWARMKAGGFPAPDLMFFTHRHPDHYSRSLIAEARALWPAAGLISPAADFPGQILLEGEKLRLPFRDLSLFFFRLPHEKEAYRDVPHYGLIVSFAEEKVLIAGDCALCAPELAARVKNAGITTAILDFPWLTLPRARAFVEEVIRPEKAVFCHLPFAEDDEAGFRAAALRALPELKGVRRAELLMDPLQRITLT